MLVNAPELSQDEVDRILRDLSDSGVTIPKPSKVDVIAEDDFEGAPILRLRVEFPSEIPADKASARIVRPFLLRAYELIRERSGYERPVVWDLVRLSEFEDTGK